MEVVWVAIINGIFGILILVGGIVLNRRISTVSSAVHETKNEVKNSHTINFRDDMDSKFKLTNSLIQGVQETQVRQGRDIISLRNTVAENFDANAATAREVREELTAFRKTLAMEE